MAEEPEPDGDLAQRVLVERRPPLSWKGIAACASVSALALVVVALDVGGFWELLAAGVFVVGALQTARGMLRKAWLGLGGSDRPVSTYLKRRLGG